MLRFCMPVTILAARFWSVRSLLKAVTPQEPQTGQQNLKYGSTILLYKVCKVVKERKFFASRIILKALEIFIIT